MGVLGAGSALAYPLGIEPRWLELTQRRVNLGLHKQVRVLHLSDFHASRVVPLSLIDDAIDIGLRQKPNLICLTGDFISYESGFDPVEYAVSLRRLSSAVPTFAVLGNHDGGEWAGNRGGYADHAVVDDLLVRAGITVLHNRAITVETGGKRLRLAGVGDLWSREFLPAQSFAHAEPKIPTVLLAHNPDSKDAVAHYPWNLMLSGHTHGGQILVPFVGPRFAPVKDLRYVAGLKPWRDRLIYVSRGVGNWAGVRFRCRPEVSVLDLV